MKDFSIMIEAPLPEVKGGENDGNLKFKSQLIRPHSLQALILSIAKWETHRRALPTLPPSEWHPGGSNVCGLCFLSTLQTTRREDRCDLCAVAQKTSKPVCYGTPYAEIIAFCENLEKKYPDDAADEVDETDIKAICALYDAEIAFLRSLLPSTYVGCKVPTYTKDTFLETFHQWKEHLDETLNQ